MKTENSMLRIHSKIRRNSQKLTMCTAFVCKTLFKKQFGGEGGEKPYLECIELHISFENCV